MFHPDYWSGLIGDAPVPTIRRRRTFLLLLLAAAEENKIEKTTNGAERECIERIFKVPEFRSPTRSGSWDGSSENRVMVVFWKFGYSSWWMVFGIL